MTTHVQPSTYEAQLREAHKARQARFAAAARGVRQTVPTPPRPPVARKTLQPVPLWSVTPMQFDLHVKAFDLWRAEKLFTASNPLKAYIRRRCQEMNVDPVKVIGASRKVKICAARQLLMWEIKTILRPSISYPELGRLFGGKDHTTCLHAVRKIEAKKARAK